MLIRYLKNISNNIVDITLLNGILLKLPPQGILENVQVGDISGVLKFLEIRYAING